MDYTYIEPEQVASLLQKKEKNYIIVDGGSIPGAINIPYHTLNTQLDHLRRVAQAVPLVIFHCMQSQIRGPKAARRYQNFTQSNQTVCVLRGGFYSWRHRYPHLVENYDAKFWEDNNY